MSDSLRFKLLQNNAGWTPSFKTYGKGTIEIQAMLPPAHLRETAIAPKPEIPAANAPVLPEVRRWLTGYPARSSSPRQ